MASSKSDPPLESVASLLREVDPDGARMARVIRETLDQLYDGQHTGRYRWDQLHKTEKTHCGTLVEINLHREFKFEDGQLLDYRIRGVEVDCKYSQTMYRWMIPPEALKQICLLVCADDSKSLWSAGLVRVLPERLSAGRNRDRKSNLNQEGKQAIEWLNYESALPPNFLLQLPPEKLTRIMAQASGQKRVNELFRQTLELYPTRGAVATIAEQVDYMKRVRGNGGARSTLKEEGIVILGQYDSHRAIAQRLGLRPPAKGEFLPLRLAPAKPEASASVKLENRWWRIAHPNDPRVEAPQLPSTKRSQNWPH